MVCNFFLVYFLRKGGEQNKSECPKVCICICYHSQFGVNLIGCIKHNLYCFVSVLYHCMCGYMFCVLLFNFVNYVFFFVFVMYYYCYAMYSCFYIYVFLLLYKFRSGYSVSLCCFVYCLCVNVYCMTAIGYQPICS